MRGFIIRRVLISLVLLIGPMNNSQAVMKTPQKTFSNVDVFEENSLNKLYETVADEIINVVKEKPNALIVLPTGSTPVKLYKVLVERFKKAQNLDFSNVQFFNLDEYVGLEENHPLSYEYYMNTYFYGPLRKIDEKRAPQPQNCHFPKVLKEATPEEAAQQYENKLQEAITHNQSNAIDLVILGVGGAYPETTPLKKVILKGGHIAFNEPGTPLTTRTHVVTLTDKTRLDTGFRFSSLKSMIKEGEFNDRFSTDVPKQALSMGLANILEAQRIIVLATSDDKAPVIERALMHPENDDFPASHLQRHQNVHWYIDQPAATLIEDQERYYNKAPQNLAEILINKAKDEQLPENKSILIVSPHPDDDVICMSATLEKLLTKRNNIHVVYAVTGSNAVRTTDKTYQEVFPLVDKEHTTLPIEERIQLAKQRAREVEATNATAILGLNSDNLIFFKAEYYKRRGLPGINALQARDLNRMKDLLKEKNPDIIFFAAENDPHGAHGLSTQLIAQTIKSMPNAQRIHFYGYRGAYAEWPLHTPHSLMIVSFNELEMERKISAIRAHTSQLDPLFPSFDPRPFWQRAYDRNKESGKKLSQLTKAAFSPYAEVFKHFSLDEFLAQYE